MIEPARRRAALRLVVLLAALFLSSPAVAADGAAPTILLVAPSGDAFEARMRAELESMGFDVQVRGTLGAEPAGSGVLAVARVVPGPPRRVEVIVVAGDATSRIPSRTASIEAPADGDDATVSVRAAEQLRAFFQPLAPPPPAPADPSATTPPAGPPPAAPSPEPPPPVPPPAPAPGPPPATPPGRPPGAPQPSVPAAEDGDRPEPGVAVTAAVGGALDVGGPGLAALVGVRVPAGEHVAIGVVAVAPLTATSVGGPEGEATLRAFVPGLDVAAPLHLAGGALRVVPSAGLAVSILVTDGEAAAPYEGTSDVASALVPFARIEVAPRITGPLRASIQALGGAALPAIGVNFAGREAAAWQPWGGAFVGATLEL